MIKQFKKVGTHSGRFHADEVMSTAILKELFDIDVVRSRDTEVLNGLDLVYDVGDGEFDHHQLEKEYRENGTPYAACGLIWRRFGKDVIQSVQQDLSPDEIEELFYYMDARLIEGIDAIDNGLRTSEIIVPTMNVSSIIAEFNPSWDSEIPEDASFHEAVQLATVIFRNMLNQRISTVKARNYVIEAFNNRIRPEILQLEKPYPWTQTLYDIDTEGEVLFVIYPRDSQYLIQTVRNNDGNYGDRKRLPAEWAGKRDTELSTLLGIEDAVFCHPARFIAGAGSMESILKMADIAIVTEEPQRVEAPQGFLDALRNLVLGKRVLIRR